MGKFKQYQYTVAAIGLIIAAFIGSLFQEIGGAMSGVIVQIGLCKEGDSTCLLKYWGGVLLIIFILGLVIDLAVKHVKHKSIDIFELVPTDKVTTSIGNNYSNGVGLKVLNNSDFDVLECFGTLEDMRCVYIHNNRRLIVESDSSFKQLGLRVSGKLRWANKRLEDTEHKATIPAKSKENVLLVLNLIIDAKVIGKGKQKGFAKDNQRYFNIPYCFPDNENSIAPGLFKVRVRINGNLNKGGGKSAIATYYDSYVYCYHKEAPFGMGTGLYWSKDPLKDKRIINDEKIRKEYYEKENIN